MDTPLRSPFCFKPLIPEKRDERLSERGQKVGRREFDVSLHSC